MSGELKESCAFRGTDYFLYCFDRRMRSKSGIGNICNFVVELDSPLSSRDLESHLQASPEFLWFASLRLSFYLPFQVPRWVSRKSSSPRLPLEIKYIESLTELPESFVKSIDIRREAPIRLQTLQLPNRTVILFSWHHSVLDARGAELFVQLIGNSFESSSPPQMFLTDRKEVPLREGLSKASEASNQLFERCKPPFLHRRTTNRSRSTGYRLIEFDSFEVAEMGKLALGLQLGPLVSIFRLAAAACAFRSVFGSDLNGNNSDVVVPVPQDQRPRGGKGPIFGNQVTFFFYRISYETRTLEEVAASLREQLLSSMRAGSGAGFATFMNLACRIPLPLYWMLLNVPTGGRISSFAFSDTGESLAGFDHFQGIPVKSAVHYPPNMSPPDFAIIFSKRKDTLSVSVTYEKSIYAEDELDRFEVQLKQYLLGEVVQVAA